MGCSANSCVCVPGMRASCLVARQPPPTLIDRVVASRAPVAGTVTVDFSGHPNKRGNSHAYVTEIAIEAVADLTTTTAMAAAFQSADIQGLLNQFRLEDTNGHQFGENLDGRDLLDDLVTRSPDLSKLSQLPDPIPNEADAQLSLPMVWRWAFGTPLPGGMVDVRGAIPLAVLQARGDAMSYAIASAIPGAPAGITFNGFGTTGITMRVWARIVWLDKPIGDHWRLSQYTEPNLSGRLRNCGEHVEYAWLRPFAEDTGGPGLTGYAGFTFRAGDQLLAGALSLAEAQQQTIQACQYDASTEAPIGTLTDPAHAWVFAGPMSVAFGATQNDKPRGASVPNAYPILLPPQHLGDMPSCQIDYDLSAMGTNTNNRFLQRTRRRQMRDGDFTRWMRDMCADPGELVVVGDNGIMPPDTGPGIVSVVVNPMGQ